MIDGVILRAVEGATVSMHDGAIVGISLGDKDSEALRTFVGLILDAIVGVTLGVKVGAVDG